MPVVVVANPKGGVGKSTLSTNIAGYFASQGHPVILGDTDRQESARLWLGLRPPAARLGCSQASCWSAGAAWPACCCPVTRQRLRRRSRRPEAIAWLLWCRPCVRACY